MDLEKATTKYGFADSLVYTLTKLDADVYEETYGEEEPFILFPLFGNGDYSGDLYNKSNRIFVENMKTKFPLSKYGICSYHESYGYENLKFYCSNWRRWWALLKDELESLETDPVLDYDKFYQVESDEKDELWGSGMYKDFLNALSSQLEDKSIIDTEGLDTHVYSEELWNLSLLEFSLAQDYEVDAALFWFDRLCNDNGQWFVEGSTLYIDLERELARVTRDYGTESLYGVLNGVLDEYNPVLWGLSVNIGTYRDILREQESIAAQLVLEIDGDDTPTIDPYM